jgi:hypothetical protein
MLRCSDVLWVLSELTILRVSGSTDVSVSGRLPWVIVPAYPPLPPVTRLESATVPEHEPSTLPGWVAALIYLGCAVVMALVLVGQLS